MVYELREDGTDMLKHVTAVKEHTFMYLQRCTVHFLQSFN